MTQLPCWDQPLNAKLSTFSWDYHNPKCLRRWDVPPINKPNRTLQENARSVKEREALFFNTNIYMAILLWDQLCTFVWITKGETGLITKCTGTRLKDIHSLPLQNVARKCHHSHHWFLDQTICRFSLPSGQPLRHNRFVVLFIRSIIIGLNIRKVIKIKAIITLIVNLLNDLKNL